jgi:hypothetical protein
MNVMFLIDHDQDVLYEVRDYCRALLLAENGSVEQVAAWLENRYAEQFAQRHHLTALTKEDWQALAESCLADTQELIGYERKNGLPTTSGPLLQDEELDVEGEYGDRQRTPSETIDLAHEALTQMDKPRIQRVFGDEVTNVMYDALNSLIEMAEREQRKEAAINDVSITGIGSLRQILLRRRVEIDLPFNARAVLAKDEQGYSFTWDCCYHDEDLSHPNRSEVTFDALINIVFNLLYGASFPYGEHVPIDEC